jgi:ferredoxin
MKLKAIHANCSGCGVCRQVCTLENFRQLNPARSLLRIEGRFPSPGDYRIRFCDQCGLCAEACPEDAIQMVDGAYRVEEDACSACMACVDACPREVMMVHPDRDAPVKCSLCGTCAELCPRRALVLADENTRKAG